MSVRATITADSPINMPITISITMPLGYWKTARDQLRLGDVESYESHKVYAAICEAVRHMEQRYEVPLEQT